jgi:hypothetical protein
LRTLRSSSLGTSSLAGCPSPDVPVNVYSQRSEDLLRPMAATPSVSLRPRGFSPPRQLLPFTAPGMLQPVPGVGSPGFPLGRSSRPCGLPERVRGPHWRSTLRRFVPRRQPFRIAAVCSPPAVRRLDEPCGTSGFTPTSPCGELGSSGSFLPYRSDVLCRPIATRPRL